ncbi:hypothetical protein KPSB59_1070015 [Klebsiella quasipneumoniae subsp. quasipneumoniae]|nr:hypothetical protein KPSB59_1070015 [Klebsiella quasipneumoniae subsp. quasipneumoniae]
MFSFFLLTIARSYEYGKSKSQTLETSNPYQKYRIINGKGLIPSLLSRCYSWLALLLGTSLRR